MTLNAFLQLIRWKNLFMLACIQLLFRYIYFPTFSIAITLSNFDFLVLVIATLAIAAAGYISNDMYDVEADKINKLSKVIVTQKVSIKQANSYYLALNAIGILAGLYLAYKINNISYVSIFIITALILKAYNSDLKKKPIIGNLLVSLLVSLSILIVGVFDIIPSITEKNGVNQYHAFRILLDYAAFAFMFMFLREMVKDIEDVNGDNKLKMNTLPIIIGRKRTAIVVFSLSFIPLILITFYSFNNFSDVPIVLAYMLIVVLLPFLYFMTKILYAKTKKDYRIASQLLKYIMLLGMFSIIIISITIQNAK